MVVNSEGLPLATHDVWLERQGRVVPPYHSSEEMTLFRGEPGVYTLHARHPGYQSVQTTVRIEAKTERVSEDTPRHTVVEMVKLP